MNNTLNCIVPQRLPAGADKRSVRREVKAQWAQCDPAERLDRSARIMEELESLPEFKQAQTLLLYWSMSREVATQAAVRRWSTGKRILLPVMEGDHLLLKPFTGDDDLVCHPWGVWEPTSGQNVPIREVDLVVAPGAAFDLEGGRLGYGKGFYDRLLSSPEAASCRSVGVCFDFQWYDHLPREAHDVAVDRVIVGAAQKVWVHNP